MSPGADAPKPRPYWLLIAAACVVPAVLDALQTWAKQRFDARPGVDWGDVVFQGAEWLFLGALTPITYVLARRFPLRRDRIGRAVAAHAAGAAALCVGWASLGVLLGAAIHHYPADPRDMRGAYASWVLTSVPWSVFMYFTVLGCVYAFTYFVEAREREAQRARLAQQLAEARLGALRMQLNPHFLFNSLNAIQVLVRDHDTQAASRMLELLGGVLRQVLHGEPRQQVPLDEELRFLQRYLAIEQVRFSDRLRVQWAVDDAARDALVPEFVLQPLVENAVRHGVAGRADAGTIEISAHVEGDTLLLGVRDDGPGYDAATAGAGVGLANVRARLETMFGDAARLEIGRAASGGTLATIRLPLARSQA
ncbi:histidine kinase internal region [Gemmatirosa kalamazoonensis]|uniref:histidine kinase n=1 Tax=Gemmatirosa kalamazoonensis TaxID=861299 RepID=W0RCQ8_9BACT|nr:histidine kinase [Gemmatirosa kalamazoonensis]AHG88899.1 histidine kinase internal region [Gemmatirosa kalamazoonensis]